MNKKRILAINAFYLPGYKGGGSIRALVNLVGHLKNEFEFVVATGSRDLHELESYPDEAKAEVITTEGYEIRYLPNGLSLFAKMIRVISEPWDLVYVNSAFSPGFSILPTLLHRVMGRRGVPIVVAPRGELMEGALRSKSFKKNLFLTTARIFRHFRGVTFHATSEDEVSGIRALSLGQARIVLAPDLPPRAGTEVALQSPKVDGILRMVFVSRIDPKKNLHFALEILGKVGVPVAFDIVGPVADGEYWSTCQKIIATLPAHIQVRHLGPVPHTDILKVFASHDAFFFPTHAENNGYVILESLLAGCPVLLSDRTPWRGLASLGVGKDISLADPDDFRLAVEEFAALTPIAHLEMRQRAQAYGRSRLQASEDIASTRTMFEEAMG
jgi:glycosyltransferase involved in cell wall biosynthesis